MKNEEIKLGRLARIIRENLYTKRTKWENLTDESKIEWERLAFEFKKIAIEELLNQKKIHVGNTDIKIGLEVAIQTIKDL